MLKSSLLWFFSLLAYFAIAQELPPIQNFQPSSYHSENQNWSISQSEDKTIYIANNGGLLEFNGATWVLHPSPNETIMRSVKVIEDKIYTGCYQEFGYWEKDSLGGLAYTSLSQTLEIEPIEDEEFWNILEVDGWIVFQSLNRIYIYNPEKSTVRIIDSKETIIRIFKVNERIYFQKANQGIYRIENGQELIFLQDPIFKEDEVVNIFLNGQELILITKKSGFYSYKEGVLSEWTKVNRQLSGISIYHAARLSDKSFALGTIANGLIYIHPEKKISYKINQSNGLLNNTVLSIFEDIDHNIWLGLDYGISYINIHSPIQSYEDPYGRLGSIYAAVTHRNQLYLGTNRGLFYRSLDGQEDFKLIKGTKGQVWSLQLIDETLFCGHHEGTFIIEDSRARMISGIQGTWDIKKPNQGSDILIQGNYDGLYVLKKEKGDWLLSNKIEGFEYSSRYFEVLDHTIFVSHEYKGVFEINVDTSFLQVNHLDIDTSLKEHNSSLAKFKGNILYACKTGIFRYQTQSKKFLKDSLLSTIYDEEDYISGRIIVDREGDQFWMFTRDNLTLITSGHLANVPTIKTIPLTLEARKNVVEYESIIEINGLEQYLIGTSSGYMTIHVNNLQIRDFSVFITNISNGINKDHSAAENLIDKTKTKRFDSNENNFRIGFHTPEYYKYLKPNYQYQLTGIYDLWSDWTTESSVFFENLPPGHYTFNVRAKIGGQLSDNTASYQFSIAKPWYITNLMLAVYALSVVIFSIFMHNVYRGYYHIKQKRLIDRNKRQLELNKLQTEKEIIRIKNEQLEKNYKNKSNELAASTMSIVKKNELLTEIKEQLIKIKDKDTVAPVIHIIDENLNHTKNWELFKEAFDNADSDFFKKLKELHPNLSPNDLKLCAYLRLNLSSKEIAPLISISPRSVEIKRYRLRKKLNLPNEENLTSYIIRI